MFKASLLYLLVSIVAVNAARLSLEVKGPSNVEDADNFTVVTTLTNTGEETVKVLDDPQSPLSQMPADTFMISGDHGAIPDFVGIKAKYSLQAAIDAGEFITLEPNESVHVKHHLADGYDFSRAGEGAYTITPRNKFYVVTTDNMAEAAEATLAGSHRAKLSGDVSRRRPSTEKAAGAAANSCSASQEAQIKEAAASAQALASAAASYLGENTSATTRYTTWFGKYTEAFHSLVFGHFQNVNNHELSTFTYDCTCTRGGTFAYVYPTDFGKIYLCGAFWRAPLTGTDSKAGTLVHESTHFDDNGGTRDHAYGQDQSKSLARYQPDYATMNADSHEYFAENTPALA